MNLKNLTFSVGGVHMDEHKSLTEKCEIERMKDPEVVHIPMSQHIGAPCTPTVKIGDQVKVGQIVGDSEAFVSAAVHASISGEVIDIGKKYTADGRYCECVSIKSDGLQTMDESLHPLEGYENTSIDEIMNFVKKSGIVGMGGAGFPLHAKLKAEDPILDIVVLNGAECEPYLTCDHRIMLENSDEIMGALKLFADLYKTDEAYIAIEENKPDAIELMEKMANDNTEYSKLKVATCKTKYPQGDSKRLSEALVGRIVPQNGVTNDVGVFLTNVATAMAYYDAVTKGTPSYERVITVSGSGIETPKNLVVKIGTPVKDILEACGGVKENFVEIVCGGPMTGKSIFDMDSPVTKTTSGILVFTEKEKPEYEESPCIRCSRCVDHCPANINPTDINAAILRGNVELAAELHADQCMECGICSFVCPAKRYLSESIKLAKREIRMASLKK